MKKKLLNFLFKEKKPVEMAAKEEANTKLTASTFCLSSKTRNEDQNLSFMSGLCIV